MPKAQFFVVDQNDCWVEMIKGEKRVENFRYGAAMVTKIVKKHQTNILGCTTKKYPLKT